MQKNIEEKEPDTFEQEMGYHISNLETAIPNPINAGYAEGQMSGFKYALVIYRKCKEGGTI